MILQLLKQALDIVAQVLVRDLRAMVVGCRGRIRDYVVTLQKQHEASVVMLRYPVKSSFRPGQGADGVNSCTCTIV